MSSIKDKEKLLYYKAMMIKNKFKTDQSRKFPLISRAKS